MIPALLIFVIMVAVMFAIGAWPVAVAMIVCTVVGVTRIFLREVR